MHMFLKFFKYNQSTYTQGYIALLSTIIIGAMLITITVGAGRSGWYTRFALLGAEAKMQSHTRATGCVNQALAILLINPRWNGDVTATYSDGTCYVYPLQKNYPQPQLVTIKVRGEVQGAITNLVAEFNMMEINIGVISGVVPIVSQHTSANVVPTTDSIWEVGVMP